MLFPILKFSTLFFGIASIYWWYLFYYCSKLYLKRSLPDTHLPTFVDKQPKNSFPLSFLKVSQQLLLSKRSLMWTYNFANPLFFKAREIKNSNVEFDVLLYTFPS